MNAFNKGLILRRFRSRLKAGVKRAGFTNIPDQGTKIHSHTYKQATTMSTTQSKLKLNLPEEELGPAINGIIFYECNDAPTPILSLLWLPLIPGIDFSDKTQASARIWHATLDYVACLPGCERVLWDVVLTLSPQKCSC